MSKKISAHCNVTNCIASGYPCLSSIRSFSNACDEVIVVDGGSTDGSLAKIRKIPKVKVIKGAKWEKDFDWTIMGRNLQIGYEACSGDWVLHFDADYIFHENEVGKLRETVAEAYLPVILIKKVNFVLSDECFTKSWLPILVNKKEYSKLGYGIGKNRKGKNVGTFLWPIVKQSLRKDGLYTGEAVNRDSARLHMSDMKIYTYDFTFMTKEQVVEQRVRFEKALTRFLGRPKEVSEKDAFNVFIGTMKHRHEKCGGIKIKPDMHSVFIREKIRNLKPNQFGYDGFGLI